MSNLNTYEKEKELLQKKIKEYEQLEKHFGTSSDGSIKYSDRKDQEFALDNMSKKKEYIGYVSFIEWIDKKSKLELQKELNVINDNIDKLKTNKIAKSITPSEEQKSIIDCITAGKHTMVDAVAGSGKTTTMIFIGRQNSNKKILQITYNKQLKLEVREKVLEENLQNLEIHTYHSLTVKFYDKDAHTDDAITKVLTKNTPPKTARKYDILVIDEVQDMTPNYFTLICKFINDMKFNGTILILGDRYQGVYEFKNADTRFLIYSNKIWTDNMVDFVVLPLQQSYRVTKQIAYFVNSVMLGENRILSNKEGKHKVYYYKWNKFTVHITFAEKIAYFIRSGYKPADIFVLSPSIKGSGKNPIKKLENELVKRNIPVYFARNEEEGIDDEIIKGKVVFTTFHQAKGRERKIVVVFGFDDTYFDFHAKDKDRMVCPSELYVAITRASEILIVLEGERDEPLSFLQKNHIFLQSCPNIEFCGKIPDKKKKPNDKQPKKQLLDETHTTHVTEITRFIGEENITRLIPLVTKIFKVKCEAMSKYTVDIPSNVKMNNGLTEDVSDLNGLVIPAMYEASLSKDGVSTLQTILNYLYETSETDIKEFIKKKMQDLDKYLKKDPISAYLCMGNLFVALSEKIHSKLTQIDKYEWLTEDMVKICHKNLSSNVGKTAKYEQELGDCENEQGKFYIHKTNMYGNIHIRGRCDAVDDTTLWEFKCVGTLQFEHLLQLVVYAWMWEKCMKDKFGSKKYKILNIKTREIKELIYENYIVDEIMSILFENKYYKREKDSDAIFIEKCKKIRKSVKGTIIVENTKTLNMFTNTYHDDDDDDNDDEDNDDAYKGNFFFGGNMAKSEDEPMTPKKIKSKITKKK
jgi:hypothetical protein